MKAIVYSAYGSTDVLHLQDVATPNPNETEILVKIHATSVTPVDLAFRLGNPVVARLYTGLFRPKITVLGTELAGEVVAVGKGVTRFQVGDEIFASTANGTGAHSQYICLPEDGAQTLKPTNMSYEQAVTYGGGLTALPFLRDHGKITAGQTILINGASGSIGMIAVQLAKHFGAHVTGVSSSRNLDFVASLGADEVIDYTRQDFTRTGKTYDVIFDVSGKSSFSRSKKALKPNGVYLTTNLGLGIVFQMLRTMLFGKKKAIFAATGLRPAQDQIDDLNFLKDQVESGELMTVIDRSYPLDQIASAYRHVETGHKRGKVVVTVPHDGSLDYPAPGTLSKNPNDYIQLREHGKGQTARVKLY